MSDIDTQLSDLSRGVEAIYTEDALRKKLASGRQLRIKLGMDPTAPDIHLGHTVVLRKMRQFQDLGHKAVLIIGDYTAKIGDPTGRDATRPVLDSETIQANAQTYLDQAGLILDRDPDKFEMHYNSSWLGELTFADVLQLTAQFTVQQMLHRDNFKKRMDKGVEIQVSEFMYPLMQAYDSVVIKADVELGGTDQTFNNLRGRDLMAKHDMEPQCVLIMPILVGLDGTEKMSKSKGNYVAVTDEPNNMFGKVMSIPDNLMDNYYTLLTALPKDEIATLVDASKTHPREAKGTLGKMIVEAFHDADAAQTASEEFTRRFADNQLPTDIETKTLDAGEHRIIDVLVSVGFAGSNGDAKRLIKGGGVKLNGEKISDPTANVTVSSDAQVLQVGKRNVCEIAAG